MNGNDGNAKMAAPVRNGGLFHFIHQGKRGQKTTAELPSGLGQLLPNIQSPLALFQARQSRTVAVLPQPLGNKCLLHPKGRLMKSSKIRR